MNPVEKEIMSLKVRSVFDSDQDRTFSFHSQSTDMSCASAKLWIGQGIMVDWGAGGQRVSHGRTLKSTATRLGEQHHVSNSTR